MYASDDDESSCDMHAKVGDARVGSGKAFQIGQNRSALVRIPTFDPGDAESEGEEQEKSKKAQEQNEQRLQDVASRCEDRRPSSTSEDR